ncbi:neutrophil collagenase-like [Apostichopus japonicus]|uniref:Matrix netalloproteinase 16 n=1 Tax=Stichopus japonicus TaxID=307972 RepID=A0A346KIW7_STIJA|nr:matrix netalloproteinase 16 [Apostichopus japonicus]
MAVDRLSYLLLSVIVSMSAVCRGTQGKTIQEIAVSPENLQTGLDFLKKYKYVGDQMDETVVNNLIDPSEFEAIIRNMQLYMPDVDPTGILDDKTIAAMAMPRCGVPDPSGEGDETIGGRLRRFSHSGGRWEERKITYRVLNAPPELNYDVVREAIRRAFNVWQTFIPRDFVEVASGQADIMMKFGEYHHGDPYPFDGPSGTLAHAFGPFGYGDPIEGDVHFDDSETFSVRTFDDINLFLVAAHEIGHSLGLGHSQDSTALMAPFYSGYQPNFELPYDDILGIQTLYGSRPDTPREKPVTVKPVTQAMQTTELPLVCQMSFDCVAYIRGEIFAFKEDRFWRVREPGKSLTPAEGYKTNEFFKGLPSGIQAAYERYYDQRILFFKGREYWVYDGIEPLPGYPKLIANLSSDLPGNLQAAATWGEYNKVYFFKRGRVYRYDEFEKKVDEGYPYPIDSVFPGVPKGLDGAFRYNDKMAYFVKGKYYYRYNDITRKVDDGYPRPFVADFFGCNPNLYIFNGVNNTDYDYFGMGNDNGGSVLSINFIFHILLMFITSLVVSS